LFTQSWEDDTVVIKHKEQGYYNDNGRTLKTLEVIFEPTPCHTFYQDKSAVNAVALENNNTEAEIIEIN
jgi:hypothetical protein